MYAILAHNSIEDSSCILFVSHDKRKLQDMVFELEDFISKVESSGGTFPERIKFGDFYLELDSPDSVKYSVNYPFHDIPRPLDYNGITICADSNTELSVVEVPVI
jgi:hypothetical protein